MILQADTGNGWQTRNRAAGHFSTNEQPDRHLRVLRQLRSQWQDAEPRTRFRIFNPATQLEVV